MAESSIELVGLVVVIRVVDRSILVIFQGIGVAETDGGLLHREIELQRRADLEAGAAAMRHLHAVRDGVDVVIIEAAERG